MCILSNVILFKGIIAVAIVISIKSKVIKSRRIKGFIFKPAALSRLFSYNRAF